MERRAVKLLDRRVVIVGAGPAGLSAAIELRRLGIRHVTMYEREQRAVSTKLKEWFGLKKRTA